ncbi:MAG TPA: hypothetical protein K8V15_09600 [Tessaracoccus flavescens]|uniref:Uncharacterized protein n=1 Tax=Tessaracoccus flavescens TaxID=399497 RepID=A0A921JRK1_9ACTN|nr:hypothetical protein [Tessaracoccus flavescens]
MSRELITHPCQGKCHWVPTELEIDDRAVFSCEGCGSEWTSAQRWTPQEADGAVSPEVAAERSAHPVA